MHHPKLYSFSKKTALLTALWCGALSATQVQAQAARVANVPSSVQRNFAPLEFDDYGVPFYRETGRGWHWYETPLQPIEETEPEPPAPPAAPPPVTKAEPPKPAGPKALSADWLKQKLPEYVAKAIDEPTDENVRAYLYLQRYAMDKAQNYATASQRVTANDPYLDINARRPNSAVGSQEADRIGYELKMQLLAELGKSSGILFYFSSTCSFCQRQWPLLKAFGIKYKMPIMPVSMDGTILDQMEPKSVVMNSGQAEMMGVTVYPSMYLFKPPNQFAVVSHGITAIEAFPDFVVASAMSSGMIDEKTFLKINGVNDMSIRTAMTGPEAEEAVKDNKTLVEYMKRKIKERK